MTEKPKHLKKFKQYFEVKEYFNQTQKTDDNYVTCASNSGEVFVNGDVNISKKQAKDLPSFNKTTIDGDFNLNGTIEFDKLPFKAKSFGDKVKVRKIPSDYMVERQKLSDQGFDKNQINVIYIKNRFKHFKYKQMQQLNKVLRRKKALEAKSNY